MGSAIEVVDVAHEDDRRWLAAGRRLRVVEPLEYVRLRELAEAFVRLEDESLEPRERHDARIAFLSGRTGGVA